MAPCELQYRFEGYNSALRTVLSPWELQYPLENYGAPPWELQFRVVNCRIAL